MKFSEFLKERASKGGFTTEDTLACLLPLMKQVARAHALNLVAPLQGIEQLQVEKARVFFLQEDRLPIADQRQRVQQIQRMDQAPVDLLSRGVQARARQDFVITADDAAHGDDAAVTVDHPLFLTDYVCWEQLLGHHDPLTDIFNLGQILAAVALGLDFHNLDDVNVFAKHRRNLFAIHADVHPFLARAIVRMTELHREKRVQELPLLIQALENYRQQEVAISVDPDQIDGFESRDLQGKQQVLLDRLQKRLFEISRRNRLLHFRSTQQAIDLTQASVPLSLDYQAIRDDQILVSDRELELKISQGQTISLNRSLNFSEAVYLPPQLNRMLREARRDLAEYGFEPLRLVLCMLRWSNLKENPQERLQSPLVLVPVRLQKERGVRDVWKLEPLSNDAEINPVVRYLFQELYDIPLPERIDLESSTLDSLYDFMKQAVTQSEPAVELHKIDRPQIRQLHTHAKRRLETYRRRAQVSGRGLRSFQQLDYSYDPANYHPLGIQIFSEFLDPQPVAWDPDHRLPNSLPQPLAGEDLPSLSSGAVRSAPGRDPDPPPSGIRTPAAETPAAVDANPYDWAFDLCAVTLANLRYRKMSLVRDYEALVTECPGNPAFDAAFSLVPRVAERPRSATPDVSERYDVVASDPTQASAIAQARQGDSYIVQGPPGTGKSQTITNLIADYVARGKRVLFVCEKRAAIDVVFARLKQSGLAELCCLIHDSQADKKSFVMDLKDTYNGFLEFRDRKSDQLQRRKECVAAIRQALYPLEEYSREMQESTRETGVATYRLLERCLETEKDLPALDPLQQARLPAWRDWNEGREAIEQLVSALQSQVPDGILARHPLRNLRSILADDPQPALTVEEGIQESLPLARNLAAATAMLPEALHQGSIHEWRHWIEICQTLQPLNASHAISLLDPASPASRDWDQRMESLRQQLQLLEQARDINLGWRERISRRDLPACLEAARGFARKWYHMIFPAWWRLRRVINRSYDFQRHPVKPSWETVLTELQAEYQAEDAVNDAKLEIARQFGFPAEQADQLMTRVASARSESAWDKPGLQVLRQTLIQADDAGSIVNRVADQSDSIRYLRGALDEFLDGYEKSKPAELVQELEQITKALDQLPDYLACLPLLQQIPEDVRRTLRYMDLPAQQLESASAWESWQRLLRREKSLAGFTQAVRAQQVHLLGAAYDDWMAVNAEAIKQTIRGRFLSYARPSSPGSVPDPAHESIARQYTNGRKILEHEFGKQMRYRSIRDLVSGDSGRVVQDLKPIWLMSPLSVSDTLPLGEPEFDVVIFDEASQITLESSIPTLFRATQAIVVGDEQQLPPTDFFSARSSDDNSPVTFQEDGETVIYDLESNSLLNHAGRNLPSTMLGWHYRSRDEALISFSNWAFYDGRLLTIPEESIGSRPKSEMIAYQADDAEQHMLALVDRPISFHFMAAGVYQQRRNRSEAEYIAALIRQLLLRRDGRTIGVIAFSEAQQNEIEKAIDRLAADDGEFSSLVEAEMVREDDGQFIGLLVKNLENIQGDERDIVILSICYGPDDQGRMLMNFGPINKSGGEKRLNVAFSRAKHHMAIVSSAKYSRITNEYNVGANCLRNYLRYAESVSMGDAATAEKVLHGLAPWQETLSLQRPVSPILRLIAERLSPHDLQVDFHIGHSDFRCDLGVRRSDDTRYRLGLLVDCHPYYETDLDLVDRELYRPRLLRIFGWKVYSILLKDWLQDSQTIVDEIVELCRPNESQDASQVSAETPPPQQPASISGLQSPESSHTHNIHQKHGDRERSTSWQVPEETEEE